MKIPPLLIRESTKNAPQIKVYFSPHGGCTEAVVRELRAARTDDGSLPGMGFGPSRPPNAPGVAHVGPWADRGRDRGSRVN